MSSKRSRRAHVRIRHERRLKARLPEFHTFVEVTSDSTCEVMRGLHSIRSQFVQAEHMVDALNRGWADLPNTIYGRIEAHVKLAWRQFSQIHAGKTLDESSAFRLSKAYYRWLLKRA